MDEVKQVIIIRKDLNMRKGKIVSQSCHASMKVILDRFTKTKNGVTQSWGLTLTEQDPVYYWLNGSFTKIVVSVDSLEELEALELKALEHNIITAKITDEGRTEFKGVPTITALAIGPSWSSKIDSITKHLNLL